ncbi:MAG: type I-C CRISPR-associated protein Cas8c/Csd1, partial [Bacillota bacterium]
MLRELVEVAGRFQAAGQLPPVAYKPRRPRWIVNLTQRPSGGAHLEGPYQGSEIQAFPSPDRQRSGVPSETNCKPYLLVDDARYVFGKPEPGREEEAQLLHRGYFALLDEACEVTGLAELRAVRDFLASPEAGLVAEHVEPRDMVAFRVDGKDPAAIPEVQRFWAGYLANELSLAERAQCGVCGGEGQVLRILPREVVILGQKCQIISF